jgi:hypothetical protein
MVTREINHENHQKCKIRFAINVDYVDEMDCDIAPLDACEVVFGNAYLWDRDTTFYKEENKYHLAKGGKAYLIKAHKGRNKISQEQQNKGRQKDN